MVDFCFPEAILLSLAMNLTRILLKLKSTGSENSKGIGKDRGLPEVRTFAILFFESPCFNLTLILKVKLDAWGGRPVIVRRPLVLLTLAVSILKSID
jgi:hypothetical protein